MTTHELAAVLLSAPDQPARVFTLDDDAVSPTRITAYVPSEDDIAYLNSDALEPGDVIIMTTDAQEAVR